MRYTARLATVAAAILIFRCTTIVASPALAQTIYRCTGANGETVFSQQPCSDSAEKVEVGPTNSAEGIDREAINAARARRSQAEQIRIRDEISEAEARIERMKTKNYDPAKCEAARQKAELIKAQDPVAYIANPNYLEYRGLVNFYCGP